MTHKHRQRAITALCFSTDSALLAVASADMYVGWHRWHCFGAFALNLPWSRQRITDRPSPRRLNPPPMSPVFAVPSKPPALSPACGGDCAAPLPSTQDLASPPVPSPGCAAASRVIARYVDIYDASAGFVAIMRCVGTCCAVCSYSVRRACRVVGEWA